MDKDRIVAWLRVRAEQASRVSRYVSGAGEEEEIYTKAADLIEKLHHDLILATSKDNYD